MKRVVIIGGGSRLAARNASRLVQRDGQSVDLTPSSERTARRIRKTHVARWFPARENGPYALHLQKNHSTRTRQPARLQAPLIESQQDASPQLHRQQDSAVAGGPTRDFSCCAVAMRAILHSYIFSWPGKARIALGFSCAAAHRNGKVEVDNEGRQAVSNARDI